MADKKWKAQERRVSNFFGTKRVPLSGRNSGHNTSSDSLHERLYIEAKYRKRIPIFDLWPEIYKKAKKENKIPVLAVKSMQISDDIFCIRKMDLEKLVEERLQVKSKLVLEAVDKIDKCPFPKRECETCDLALNCEYRKMLEARK